MSVTRSTRHLTPDVELYGDWAKTRRVLNGLDSAILIGQLRGQKSALNKLEAIIKRHIRENGSQLGWQPLSKAYKKRKKRLGGDPGKMLRLSNTYYNNIKVWSKGTTSYLGVEHHIRNQTTGGHYTVGQIASILEHGSGPIPARPLWAPSFKQFGGSTRIKAHMVWHIRDQIMKQLGVKAKITF